MKCFFTGYLRSLFPYITLLQHNTFIDLHCLLVCVRVYLVYNFTHTISSSFNVIIVKLGVYTPWIFGYVLTVEGKMSDRCFRQHLDTVWYIYVVLSGPLASIDTVIWLCNMWTCKLTCGCFDTRIFTWKLIFFL